MGGGGSDDEVDYREEYRPWPAGQPFPLTPLEAWYIMRGYVATNLTIRTAKFVCVACTLKEGDHRLLVADWLDRTLS